MKIIGDGRRFAVDIILALAVAASAFATYTHMMRLPIMETTKIEMPASTVNKRSAAPKSLIPIAIDLKPGSSTGGNPRFKNVGQIPMKLYSRNDTYYVIGRVQVSVLHHGKWKVLGTYNSRKFGIPQEH